MTNVILIMPNEEFVNKVLEKKEFIDEDQLIVNHENVDKAIIPLLSKIESMDIELSKYFTVDGKVLLNALLSRIKVFAPNCLKCTKEIKSDNVIICSKCKNSFHPKCVGVTYVPKKKAWYCSELCHPE